MTLRPLVWGTLVAGTGLILSGIVWGTWLRAGNGTPPAEDVSAPGPLLANELPRLLPSVPGADAVPLATAPGEEPSSSVPSPAATERDQGVRETINRLMPQASVEEREIWFQQFRDLPPGVVEDLLKFRRDTQGGGSPLWGDNSLMSPTILKGTRATPLASAAGASNATSLLRTLGELQRIAAQNLLHSQTAGYSRVTPHLVPGSNSGTSSEPSVLGLSIAGTSLDLQPGPLCATGRSLDVAIESAAGSPSFLPIATSQGPGYTRRGRLEIDENRQLGVRFAAEFCPLEPRIQIPPNLDHFEVSAQGELSARGNPQGMPKTLGSLQLVQFPSPESLRYATGGWLEATAASGAAHPAPQQDWSLKPRALEGSNVDSSAEQRQLDWVRQQRELIQAIAN